MSLRQSMLCLFCGALLCLPATTRAQCSPGEAGFQPDRDNTLYQDDAGALSNGAGQYIFLWADGWLELAELQVFENPAHSRSTEPVEWKLMMDPLSWGNAEASCAHMGGHLASIHSRSMQHDLMQVDDLLAGGASVWIGLKCALATYASFARISLTRDLSSSDVSGEAGCDGDAFTWSDGTENDWSKWADGEPNVR